MISLYPTDAHADAAEAIVDYFRDMECAEAVLLVNSCARGKATADSCLDILVYVADTAGRSEAKEVWDQFYSGNPVFARLQAAGRFADVHLTIATGDYEPRPRKWTGGPDDFEIVIGNHLAYSVVLWERAEEVRRLRAKWLPYYDEELRSQRLETAIMYGINNLDHIPLYIPRGLYFQSFDRLHKASKEFLQALFISRRTYPIAYDKWIKEQVAEILGLPDVYRQLTNLFEISRFESNEIGVKAEILRSMFEAYVHN